MVKDVALVLEGGGFRGLYGAAPLDYFVEKGIEFPYIIGVSMGACNAANYISKQPGRSLNIPYSFINDERYMSYKRLFTKGELFGMDFIYNEIPNRVIPWDFEEVKKSTKKFIIVTTNCETGEPFYIDDFNKYNILDSIKASTSLPVISKIVDLNGVKLLDGGVTDSIPFKKAFSDGYKKVVIILTQPKGYQKKASSIIKIAKLFYRKYPKLVEAIQKRHEHYNQTIQEIETLEKEGRAFVIRPETVLPLKRIERDREKLKTVFDIGYNQIDKYISELMDFLK
ncbi:patatin family protein [bacterium]|nr:patatin family protein [bacterium]